MFIATHAILGAFVGGVVSTSPGLAFFLGFISHFLADLIPHGDTILYRGYVSGTRVKRAVAYVVIDSIVAILFVLVLFNTRAVENRLAISAGIAGSVLPDLLVAIYFFTRLRLLKLFYSVHFFFHNAISNKIGDLSFRLGFAMQFFVFVALLTRIV